MPRRLLMILLLAGCGSPGLPVEVPEPPQAARAVPVDLDVAGLGSYTEDAPVPPFSVEEVPGGVLVAGGYATAGGGFALLADGWRDGDTLRLELAVEPLPGDVARPSLYAYSAALRDVPPGQYRFHLVWRMPDRRVLVHRTEVRIPVGGPGPPHTQRKPSAHGGSFRRGRSPKRVPEKARWITLPRTESLPPPGRSVFDCPVEFVEFDELNAHLVSSDAEKLIGVNLKKPVMGR